MRSPTKSIAVEEWKTKTLPRVDSSHANIDEIVPAEIVERHEGPLDACRRLFPSWLELDKETDVFRDGACGEEAEYLREPQLAIVVDSSRFCGGRILLLKVVRAQHIAPERTPV